MIVIKDNTCHLLINIKQLQIYLQLLFTFILYAFYFSYLYAYTLPPNLKIVKKRDSSLHIAWALKIYIYLFGKVDLSCVMQTLSCGMWDLVS